METHYRTCTEKTSESQLKQTGQARTCPMMEHNMSDVTALFNRYIELRNTRPNRDDYDHPSNYEGECHSIEMASIATCKQLQQLGYTPVFTHMDDNWIYHYELKEVTYD